MGERTDRMYCYVLFDLETTGCSGVPTWDTHHRIVQIAAMHGERSFESLVNPEVHVPTASTKCHRKTNAQVRKAPLWAEVAVRFVEWCSAVSVCRFRKCSRLGGTWSGTAFGGKGVLCSDVRVG